MNYKGFLYRPIELIIVYSVRYPEIVDANRELYNCMETLQTKQQRRQQWNL